MTCPICNESAVKRNDCFQTCELGHVWKDTFNGIQVIQDQPNPPPERIRIRKTPTLTPKTDL